MFFEHWEQMRLDTQLTVDNSRSLTEPKTHRTENSQNRKLTESKTHRTENPESSSFESLI